MGSTLRTRLIDLFSEAGDGFISGQKISDALGCSRTAVWKHIEELRKEGYEVEAVRRKGYRLIKKPGKLSESEIRFGLKTEVLGKQLHYRDVLPSTQKTAHELANDGAPEGTLVVADKQTAGRGRMARVWHSQEGNGIWMSLILRPDVPLQKTPQLTLLSAVAVVQAIEAFTGVQAAIKWPNDLMIHGKKAVGILTELQAEEDRVRSVILGIGINVNQQETDFPVELQDIATSLSMEAGEKIDRAGLIQEILLTFEKRYQDYLNHGFIPIKLLWESYAVGLGNELRARTLQGTFYGKSLGIDDEGVLLLETRDGIKKIYSADIELN
ncbi:MULTISPECIES: biotin--[acetyl-CoA-carboxylase] ligase [Bacillus]|uniref:biotin--[acetyl-CoA-carboxylase] ligase n=1 Tax=Bacillus TaxID=1386 RepID=UPI000B92CA20|nr:MULTISPECIES: biotin--[acetyl-CoA-carboxylase] ligase [Bacillus amyloliquefaciens group]ASS64556.1 Bifunctional ligase/repressor BirA [Bacillus velezensis]ATC49583.1 Bifunctional ligase/repressor BirA [Bacillus velezensis]MCW5193623.1 Bifunctional ligase/repressor BirA [Bacillus amyloliquefaciens]QOC78172.1 biotin--[acetyl-CoA-carboxylase] ligase [Bacillus velezensis]QYM55107.1 biotin--[acetyl-CoA-carboxylase] ligase [Bacillus velezensis]